MDALKNDDELFAAARKELFTAVVGDVMDRIGLLRQFLPPAISPLRLDMVVIGRAMTVLEADLFEDCPEACHNPLAAKPFGLMLEALDDLKSNEVYVCSGASPRYACWGELMSVRARQCGAAGAVINGYSRDTPGILALNFPTFSLGRYAQDQGPRGKVVDYRIPIEIGEARIEPGDIVFADLDGVCVVPRSAERDVFAGAFEKARDEKVVRHALEKGKTAVDAFAEYGIL